MASTQNEVEIRNAIGQENQTAADLDWENVFGVRFHSWKQLRTFVETRVAMLSTAKTTHDELETKIHFVQPTVAVVDVYSYLQGRSTKTQASQAQTVGFETPMLSRKRTPSGLWCCSEPPICGPHGSNSYSAALLASYKGTYEARAVSCRTLRVRTRR